MSVCVVSASVSLFVLLSRCLSLGEFYDAPYKVRCIKHLDILTVGSEGVFITVNMFLKSND